MKPVKINGFTIIETMLFLGISGLLILGLLVGTGSSINTQRYRDSVTSLQSFLQQQYSNVANVANDHDSSVVCDAVSVPVGQSDCVVLGKYITTSSDGASLSVKDVLGTTCPTDATNDLDALQNCGIITSSVNAETYDLEWGSSAIKTDSTTMVLSMLILRSPISGVIRTFISSSHSVLLNDTDISGIVSDTSALQNSAKICVGSDMLFMGTKMAVQIDSNTTSASGIEVLGDGNGCH
jgi:type II secretory pathway pseudopilin PulG